MVVLTKEGRPIPPAGARASNGAVSGSVRRLQGPAVGDARPGPELAAPVFERVREDPPETARKPRASTADQILPILEDIERVGDDLWWRVGLFPKPLQAGAARTSVLKRLGKAAAGWEFKVAKVPPPGPGASALYARRKAGGR